MMRDKQASDDGINVLSFKKGEDYDLSPKLHTMFEREGWAEECSVRPGPKKKKSRGRPPKNKARRGAPEDK